MSPEEFAAAANVSRETLDRLKAYAGMLQTWNNAHNLVGAATLPDIWRRHILDSAQLVELIPDNAKSLMDMGSGAGLPGLVLAVLLNGSREIGVILVESNTRKCAFLRHAVHELDLGVEVRCSRVEGMRAFPLDVVTARALAPLDRLLVYAAPFCRPTTRCLFPKGQHVEAELTEATKCWNMKLVQVPSRTDPASRVLCIEDISRV